MADRASPWSSNGCKRIDIPGSGWRNPGRKASSREVGFEERRNSHAGAFGLRKEGSLPILPSDQVFDALPVREIRRFQSGRSRLPDHSCLLPVFLKNSFIFRSWWIKFPSLNLSQISRNHRLSLPKYARWYELTSFNPLSVFSFRFPHASSPAPRERRSVPAA